MSNTMQYQGYTASMTFDPDDKVIVGRVLDIDDILTFHGESVSEFESNFRMVVDDYIAACSALGTEPERPASGRLMLRVSPEVHAASLKAAALSGTSLNRWAEQALRTASRRLPKSSSPPQAGSVRSRRGSGNNTPASTR